MEEQSRGTRSLMQLLLLHKDHASAVVPMILWL